MEDYCELWSAGPPISEEYNYGYDQYQSAGPPILEEYNYGYDQYQSAGPSIFDEFDYGYDQPSNGLHGLVDHTDELKYLYQNKANSDNYLGSNDVLSFMNTTKTLGEVSTDDYDIIGTNDNVMFLYGTKAPSEPYNNCHTNSTYTADQGHGDQSFLDGVEDEIAQLVSKVVNSNCNSTLEKPSPISPLNNRMPHALLDDDLDLYEANSSITENAQGLQQPCTRRTSKSSEQKDKSSTNEVLQSWDRSSDHGRSTDKRN